MSVHDAALHRKGAAYVEPCRSGEGRVERQVKKITGQGLVLNLRHSVYPNLAISLTSHAMRKQVAQLKQTQTSFHSNPTRGRHLTEPKLHQDRERSQQLTSGRQPECLHGRELRLMQESYKKAKFREFREDCTVQKN